MKNTNLTRLDPNQIHVRTFDEENDSLRVTWVGDFKPNQQNTIQTIEIPTIIKESNIEIIKIPEIITKSEIVYVDKIITQEKVQIVEIPKIIEKIEIKEIEKPIIIEKNNTVIQNSKLYSLILIIQSITILGLLIKLIF